MRMYARKHVNYTLVHSISCAIVLSTRGLVRHTRAYADRVLKYESGPRSINCGLGVSCNSRGDWPKVYLRVTKVDLVSRATAEEMGLRYTSGPLKWTLCLAQQLRRGGRSSYPCGGTTAPGLTLSHPTGQKKMTQFGVNSLRGTVSKGLGRVSKLFVFFNLR
jgi:hypothetical protein